MRYFLDFKLKGLYGSVMYIDELHCFHHFLKERH